MEFIGCTESFNLVDLERSWISDGLKESAMEEVNTVFPLLKVAFL